MAFKRVIIRRVGPLSWLLEFLEIAMRNFFVFSMLAFTSLVSASDLSPVEQNLFQISPWQLGMTREQVTSFTEFGPYLNVKVTGGLETNNATFQGKKTNVSFVFDETGIDYIQVWKYEGTDRQLAKNAILEIFDLFNKDYGGPNKSEYQTEGNRAFTRENMDMVIDSTFDSAIETARTGKKQKIGVLFKMGMSPQSQPAGSRLNCNWAFNSRTNSYYVFLFQDKLTSKPRDNEPAIVIGKL